MASKYRTIQTRKKLPAHMGAQYFRTRGILQKYISRGARLTGANDTPYTRYQYSMVSIGLLFFGVFTIIRAWFPCSGYLAVGPHPARSLRNGLYSYCCHRLRAVSPSRSCIGSMNMSDLAMQYYLNLAARDGLLFTPYEARCIFARSYDLLTNRFGA